MPDHRLSTLEDAARDAIAAGSFAKAQELLARYCEAVERTARTLPPGDGTALAIVERARRFLAWAQSMVLSARAHLSGQIRQLPSVSCYATPESRDRVRTWRLDA